MKADPRHPLLDDVERFPPALLQELGFVALATGPQRAEVRFQPRPAFAHSGGTTVQGGYVAAFLDNAMAFAAAACDGRPALATLEMKVSYLGRAGLRPLVASAWVRRMGRSVAFVEAALHDDSGALLATASSTCKVL